MSEKAELCENNEGVHMMNPVATEYTICGDAFDIGTTENGEPTDILPTKKNASPVLNALR